MGLTISCCCKKREETNTVSSGTDYFDFSEISYILDENEKNKSKDKQDSVEV